MASLTKSIFVPILLVVLIMLGLFLIMKIYVIDDYEDQITRLDREIADLDMKVKQAEAFEQEKPKYEEEYKKLMSDLETQKKILPKEKETDALVRRLEKLAKDSNAIKIEVFRPQSIIDHGFYYEWPISISCKAGYNSLGLFFEEIANFERIFNVYNLTLESLKSGTEVQPTVTASFTASTFVYTGDETEKIK
ncbi:MAG: type 4a pilus biogenesis protein PilO [Acidobacteria bacterium]|nr:type 4a pilus biogenesis protein PilO [Acidobacteriota bacterium]